MNAFEEHQLFIPIINDSRFALTLKELRFKNSRSVFNKCAFDAILITQRENKLSASEANYITVRAALWDYYAQQLEEEEAERQYLLSTPKNLIPPEPQPQPKEPTVMAKTTPAFETKHFVYGVEASALSDNELITAIKDLEAGIRALRDIKTESQRIKTKIEQLDQQRLAIAALLDARP